MMGLPAGTRIWLVAGHHTDMRSGFQGLAATPSRTIRCPAMSSSFGADAVCDYVMATGKVHVDDTPVDVLQPGKGKPKTGRLWVYVRDDRNAG